MNEQITGALFKQMVLHGAAVITGQKQAINDQNVFPVPDGDTGTNMSMTIGAAVAELRKTEPPTLTKAAVFGAAADYAYETYGLTPVFLPIERRLDVGAAQLAAQHMKAPHYILPQTGRSDHTIGLFARMQAVVSMRLHALVFLSLIHI